MQDVFQQDWDRDDVDPREVLLANFFISPGLFTDYQQSTVIQVQLIG